MNWRRSRGGVTAILAAVVLAGGTFLGAGAAVYAAPATRTSVTIPAYGVPHEASKVMLHETSMDGPALWTQQGPSYPVGPLAVLAWTGMDGRLNYVFTNDGFGFFGKVTLNERSVARPAVVRGAGPQGQASYAPVALAWIGTDVGHHLNVLYDVPGKAPMKLTLWNDTSFTAPALGVGAGGMLLAWAGTDGNHSLNLLPISITDNGLVAGAKTTLWDYHSLGQPGLAAETYGNNQFLLSWSDLASHRVAWATSPDGKTWQRQPTFSQTSNAAPSMMGLVEQLAHIPPYWLGWTGTDAAHHVNVLYASALGQWTTNYVKATLPETAVGGAVVGFVLSPPDQQMWVAWTGTDSLHHLNIARVGV